MIIMIIVVVRVFLTEMCRNVLGKYHRNLLPFLVHVTIDSKEDANDLQGYRNVINRYEFYITPRIFHIHYDEQ